jgi:hypothetical protein
MPNRADSENDVILEMHHLWKYEEFSCIDDSFQCYNGNEDYDEGTDEQIVTKHQKILEDQGSNEDGPTESERVTNQDTRKCIPELLLYFMQQDNEGSPIPRLETSAEFAPLQWIMRTRQAALDHFLQRH